MNNANNANNAEKSGSGSEGSFLEKMKTLLGLKKPELASAVTAAGNLSGAVASCCSDRVHIAYRGVSDDRLYLAENRTINEVKYFRPIGLRIFCAVCRKRLS
jgi:hypothetical protein